MANHGWAHLKRKTSPEEITGFMTQGNRLRFNNLLEIQYFRPESPKYPYHWEINFENEESGVHVNAIFILDARMRKFEWRHTMDTSFGWWMQQWFAEYIVYRIDGDRGIIHDEGVDETWAPDYFIKYPTVGSWMYAFYKHMPTKIGKHLAEQGDKEMKEILGVELYKVISHEKKVLDSPDER